MNPIDTITAATDILAAINRDLANRPNFTMTRAQLDARIFNYTDRPDATATDFAAIRDLTLPLIRCIRD